MLMGADSTPPTVKGVREWGAIHQWCATGIMLWVIKLEKKHKTKREFVKKRFGGEVRRVVREDSR